MIKLTKEQKLVAGTRLRGRKIRHYIVEKVGSHTDDIAQVAAAHFGISRQAVNTQLRRLVSAGILIAQGATRSRRYALAVLDEKQIVVPLIPGMAEDAIWRTEVVPFLSDIPQRAHEIWQYGCTEMLNNAIDHSAGTKVILRLQRTAATIRIILSDDGEGIFRKVTRELQLDDERHAVLELAKGKLTTDPENHTGEGIFFTSRLFDEFYILSGNVFFSHHTPRNEDWILEAGDTTSGTQVRLQLNNNTTKMVARVLSQYTTGGDYEFSRTVVPVHLARYGNEALISRSQAKRLLARFDRFRTVVLDFTDVERIGQGFADEVFRVFAKRHRDVELVPIKTNRSVKTMIRRVKSMG